MMVLHFKNCLTFYFRSGEDYQKAEDLYDEILPLVRDLCNGLGVNVSHEVYDDYEDESFEVQGIRRPLLQVAFERDLQNLSSAFDLMQLFRSLGQLFRTGYAMKVEFQDRSRIPGQGQKPLAKG